MNKSESGGVGASGGRRNLGPRRPVGRLRVPGAKPSARRCLFGPVDHQETDDFLKEMNRQFDEQKKEVWGFDFKTGRPVPGGHPVYEWVSVGVDDDIPCAYGRLGESWRRCPEIASWSNDDTELRVVGVTDSAPISPCSDDRSRKRLRRLSSDNPEPDTALTSDCPNADDKSVAKHLIGCSNPAELEGASKPGLPSKNLRKSKELLEKQRSSLTPSTVPAHVDGSSLPSTVRTKAADMSEDFPTTSNDTVVTLPNPRCNALPEDN